MPLSAARTRALRMIEEQVPLQRVLAYLASSAEELCHRNIVASILLLDREGLLRNGASPNLPADYLDAIDRLKPHPDLGTCASAAATGNVVVTRDFLDDSRWAELKHLPIALGFRGAWSMPIKDDRGRVLGTFGSYFFEPRVPTDHEQAVVAQLVPVAARAIAAAHPVDPALAR
ncbi:GAF domain-containing protein [Ramlibacter sp. PS4R-6]|uniref:GAF domain-containing protein n=1 Tax=Ramlibacter sp. PS4R-6 TaxID=3133438 RepID=UPI0030B289F9